MWDGFNKRKFPRINTQCEIQILSDEDKTPIRTGTENIGAGGVCVILERSLERFSKCRVKLDLKDKKLSCNAKVVWIVPTRETGKNAKKRFDTGLEFTDLDTDQISALRSFIEKSVQKVPV